MPALKTAAMRGFLRESRGTRRKSMQPMKVCTQIAGVALLIVLGLVPAWAASGSVSGVVRDSGGVPQIGAQVQLLRPDLTIVASVYTNAQGRFSIATLLPGHYALKAM